MKPYSKDLCQRIIRHLQGGNGPTEVARHLQIDRSTVYRVRERYERSGDPEGKMPGGHRRSRLEKHRPDMEKWLQAEPDLTLAELEQRCLERLSLRIHSTSICRYLGKIGYRFKKNVQGQRTRAR